MVAAGNGKGGRMKTLLTKAMREDAVRRMVVELADPDVDAAKGAATTALARLLQMLMGPAVREAYEAHPEYFYDCIKLLVESFLARSEETYLIVEGVPAAREIVHCCTWSYAVEVIVRLYGDFGRDAMAKVGIEGAVTALLTVIEMRDALRKKAEQTLAQFRTVEALVEQWPEAKQFITIPAKPMLPAVRCDELVAMVKRFSENDKPF